ncbi:MAG: cation-translocating P-type ATPase [Candidatus Daviesbacteria bacterium]|nr:cation-translocating P-type ATPase [Candidatus Daviesbacteria bacterium]
MKYPAEKIGLTSHQAGEQLKRYGLNELPQRKTTSAAEVFLRQMKTPFAYLLLGATILSAVIGDKLDSFLIGGILVLNSILGFWQEYKASKELEELRKLEVEYARVERGGKQTEIPSSEIVPGDIVILESGDRIPADGQILESYALQVNESVLTGESLPVAKSAKKEENLVFFATTVVFGRGKVLILQTGARTKFGALAETLSSIEDEQTPFEKALASFSKVLGLGALAVSALIFILRILQGYDVSSTLLFSIVLMVAVVPEGLPAVVTIILALGMRKMYRKKALVRKMIAIESLGTATVICTDKTGTLTKNEMRVKEVSIKDTKEADFLKCAVFCNSASLILKEDEGSFDIFGDTTEGALLLWAKDQGKDIDLMRLQGKLIEEIPFNLETRKMTVLWEEGKEKTQYTKGAPEVLLFESKLSEADQKKWEFRYQQMAKKGLRVLAFSKDKEFLGLAGIADEVRPEVKEAIALTKQAGIKVVMVTGDNELTARSIGEEVGLLSFGDEIMIGSQLNDLSEEDLLQRIGKVKIFARITPQEKLRIVKAYQSLGEVVAVTGDGVNDVLALKQAEVGVSMGKIGTDVSKEASDIILLDDNFATLTVAIEQGRLIYNNILKVIKFLLAGNLSEMLLIGVAAIFSLPSPLLPIQILWINFVTDGPPALALGFDTASRHLMQIPPRKKLGLLSKDSLHFIIFGGVAISAFCFFAFYFTFESLGLQTSRAITFTVMIILQMMLPFIMRRHHGILSNKKLLASVVMVLFIQVLIMVFPPLRSLFKI